MHSLPSRHRARARTFLQRRAFLTVTHAPEPMEPAGALLHKKHEAGFLGGPPWRAGNALPWRVNSAELDWLTRDLARRGLTLR